MHVASADTSRDEVPAMDRVSHITGQIQARHDDAAARAAALGVPHYTASAAAAAEGSRKVWSHRAASRRAALGPDEAQAATMVAARFRGHVARRVLNQARSAASVMQRHIRGFNARSIWGKQRAGPIFTWTIIWGAPTRLSQSDLRARSGKSDLTCLQRFRDSWLDGMVRLQMPILIFTLLGGLCALGVVVFWVVLFFPTTFGAWLGSLSEIIDPACNVSQYNQSLVLSAGNTAYPPRVNLPGMLMVGEGHYVAHVCTRAQWWFNACVKYIASYFAFINILPLPWTLSIFMHTFYPHPDARDKKGVDFYGRRTPTLWFHLPLHQRKLIVSVTLVALVVSIFGLICKTVVFASYLQIKTWP